MDTDNAPMPEEEAASGPSVQTLITAACVVFAVFAAFLAYYLVGSGPNPEKECVYRGGTWTDASGCIFESAEGTTQVGMKLPSLTLRIPDAHAEATFKDVEIGSSAGSYSASFAQENGVPDGSVALMHEFGRVEKTTGDLVVPFAVNYGGTGTFSYLAIFQKTGTGYVHTDSLLVGDRIGIEGLSIAAPEEGAYVAKLLYRDRQPGEAMAEVPRDPRTVEAIVREHEIGKSYVMSREGVLYKDILAVKTPDLYAEITSPLTIEGVARGPWYFEASFPIMLVDSEGKTIAEGHAEAQGDWMTQNYVPFKATLTFTVPNNIASREATLVLKKDNPSGLPENEDSFEIPVTLK